MLGKKDNPFLSRMKGYETRAIENCSDSIKPLIQDFYTKCIKSKVKWNGEGVDWNIENLFEASMYFAENTSNGEIIEGEDLQCIKGIMIELEKLYTEIINSKSSDKSHYYSTKISLISEIFCKNMVGMKYNCQDENNIHDGKIFERYKDLYLIISLVNNHYDELLEKGVGLHSLWYPFWEVFKAARAEGKPLSEDEKISYFIGLINGSMKFHPVYEYKAVGYTIKPINYNETIVNNINTSYDEEKSLPQTNVKFEIEGEREQRILIRRTK